MEERDWVGLMIDIAASVGLAILSGYMTKKIFEEINPTAKSRKDHEMKKQQVLDILKKKFPKLTSLTDYEYNLLNDFVLPEQVDCSFDDIGGLDDVKEEIRNMVLLPLQQPEFFHANNLLELPKGILLYGPPGTGKTMIAKAIAKESNAAFLSVQLSSINNMWLGESEKIIDSLFSLAKKLSPCILFIDEADILLGSRKSFQNEASSSIKGEFLQLWDGLTSSMTEGDGQKSEILIIAATNRPWDIDKAILRRLPRTFLIDLPKKEQRKSILERILRDQKVEKNLIEEVAKMTDGYSGSDLKELCKQACFYTVQEVFDEGRRLQKENVRSMTISDFKRAMHRVLPTGAAAFNYQFLDKMKDPRKNSPVDD